MKVVLFCGGQGMRLRDYSDAIPKPMVRVGYRPILWHVMKYYAHYGHRDFILCLGYKADVIKDYFLNYDECVSNDFVLRQGGKELELLATDIDDWKITFVDTGLHTSIGERLVAVREHLGGEELFFANYADGVTDLPLPQMVDFFVQNGKTACFLGARPNYTFHIIDADESGVVHQIQHVRQSGLRINGGYFLFRQAVFDYLRAGEDLVAEPFDRLARAGELTTYAYDGFWACMDTFKEKQLLDEIHASGEAPWEAWKRGPSVAPSRIAAMT